MKGNIPTMADKVKQRDQRFTVGTSEDVRSPYDIVIWGNQIYQMKRAWLFLKDTQLRWVSLYQAQLGGSINGLFRQ